MSFPRTGVLRILLIAATMGSIMNKLTPFAFAITISAVVALAGCSTEPDTTAGPSSTSASNSAAAPTPEAPTAPDLTGTWKQTNSASAESYQEAQISGDVITINWVTDSGDTTSVYWVGTFTAPADASTPYTWTSTRDTAATDSAMLASTDATKEFTFQDDTISYSASALGTTTTIKLSKN